MRYTVTYGKKPQAEPGTGFAAFQAFSDAHLFAGVIAQQEPGIVFSVYDDGALLDTFKTDENEGEK